MKIEEVMHRAHEYAAQAEGVVKGCATVEERTDAHKELRAALLALVAQARNAEAEACIELCQCFVRMVDSAEAIDAIRARIAARAEGGK